MILSLYKIEEEKEQRHATSELENNKEIEPLWKDVKKYQTALNSITLAMSKVIEAQNSK